MNRCKDCQHWGKVPDEWATGTNQTMWYYAGMGECKRVAPHHWQDREARKADGIPVIEVLSEEVAEIYMPPDFGCVFFESKP